jgi:hypothetical protein
VIVDIVLPAMFGSSICQKMYIAHNNGYAMPIHTDFGSGSVRQSLVVHGLLARQVLCPESSEVSDSKHRTLKPIWPRYRRSGGG